MGFLFGAALAGTALIGWPLYLHLFRRQQPKAQVVPSLHLFASNVRQHRRRRITDLLLLLCRVLALLALCLLVAQPFVRSVRRFPLPRIDTRGLNRVVGVVFDDSLASVAADETESRLERQKRWLLSQLERLPADIGVCLTTVCMPCPTPVMSVDSAREAVSRLTSVPTQGNLREALTSLVDVLQDVECTLLVVGPRLRQLWGADGDETSAARLLVYDTTACGPDAHLRDVVPDSVPEGSWRCRLSGAPDRLAGRTLSVRRGQEELRRAVIAPEDALRGWVRLNLPAATPGECLAARLESVFAHPWFDFYFQPGRSGRAVDGGVLILHTSAPASAFARKVLGAAIRAVRPQLQVEYANAAGPAAFPAHPSSTVVLAGLASVPEPLLGRLRGQLSSGGQLLVVPPPSGGNRAAGGGILPEWGEAEAVEAGLVHESGAGVPSGMDELILSGLLEMVVGSVRPCRFTGEALVVLRAAAGQPLLTVSRLASGGVVWALGVPVEKHEQNAVYHPLFPHLLGAIVSHRVSSGGVDVLPVVGRPVRARDLLGSRELNGILRSPDGHEQPVWSGVGTDRWLHFSSPGVHWLEAAESRVPVAVNFPRLDDDSVLTRDEWAGACPQIAPTWLEGGDSLPLTEFETLTAAGADAPPREYDLSSVVAVVLVLSLLGEGGIFLAGARARREGAHG